jgi:hypothetical protein
MKAIWTFGDDFSQLGFRGDAFAEFSTRHDDSLYDVWIEMFDRTPMRGLLLPLIGCFDVNPLLTFLYGRRTSHDS